MKYPSASNVSFSTAAVTMIISRAVGNVKCKAKDCEGNFRIITFENVYYIPQQQHNLVAVCQLKRCVASTWGSLYFKTCTWQDATGVIYPFAYVQNELVWSVHTISEFGETTCDGIVVPKSLATIRSQARHV